MVTVERAELQNMTDSAAKRQVENGLKPLNDKVDSGFKDINKKLDMALNCLMGSKELGIPGIVNRVECLEDSAEYFDARRDVRKELIDDYTKNGSNWNAAGEYARNMKGIVAFLGVISIGSIISIVTLIESFFKK